MLCDFNSVQKLCPFPSKAISSGSPQIQFLWKLDKKICNVEVSVENDSSRKQWTEKGSNDRYCGCFETKTMYGRVGEQSCHLTAEKSKSITGHKTSFFTPSFSKAILSTVNLTVTLS